MGDFKNIRESDERLLAEMRVSNAEDSLLYQNSWRKMLTPYKHNDSPRSSTQSPSLAQMHKVKQSISNFKY
jgi:hypothetical protein